MSAIDELIEMYISEFGEDGRAVDAKKELSALREAAQHSVQPTPPTACEFCGHVPAKSNDGLRNPANTAGG